MKKLIDRKLFQRKFLLHLLGNSYVIFPFAAGCSIAFVSWVFNLEPKILYLFGSAILSILVPIGSLISKWATGTEDIAKQVHHEILQETHQKQEDELNILHEQLKADGDNRTETMLQELRALHISFQEEGSEGWMGTLPITIRADITNKVSELFTQAVQCLKNTLKMHQKSTETQLGTNIKGVLQQHREQQIKDVQQTIVQLSHLYARMLTLNPESDETELTRLRSELDQSLAFAKQVDAKLRELTPSSHDYDSSQTKDEK